MRKNLLELVVCPLCGNRLALESFDEPRSEEETTNGLLSCECGAAYPVIGGIPRLLPTDLQSMLWEMHPEFYRDYRERLPVEAIPQEYGKAEERGEPDQALSKQ